MTFFKTSSASSSTPIMTVNDSPHSTYQATTDQRPPSQFDSPHQDPTPSEFEIDKATQEKERREGRQKLIKFLWNQIKSLSVMILIDVGIPLALYYATREKLGYVVALVIGGIPPLLHVLYKFWRQRKIDIIGCIFVVSFIGSAVLSLITGDARIALFRDAAVDILISLIFLVTLLPIHTKWLDIRPLCYLITAQMTSEAAPMEWVTLEDNKAVHHSQKLVEWMWDQVLFFKRFCYILTFLWGFIMMADFVIKAVLILGTTMTIDQLVVVNNVLQIVITVTMTTGSMIASGFMHKRISGRVKEWNETHVTPEQFAAKQQDNEETSTKGLIPEQSA